MFEDFVKNHPMEDMEKPSRKRVKANRAALRSLIEQEEAMDNIRIKKHRKRFIAAAVAAAAVIGLTVTAGAVADWDFERIFGKGAVNAKPYIIGESDIKVEKNTFEDYDIDVLGLAADDSFLYLVVNFTAKNGASIDTLINENNIWGHIEKDRFLPGESFGYGSRFGWRKVSGDSAEYTLQFSLDPIKSGTVTIYESSDHGDPDKNEKVFKLHFNTNIYENTVINIGRDVEMPLRKRIVDDEYEYSTETWYLEKAEFSGLSVKLTCGYVSDRKHLDEEKIYLILDDGTKAKLKLHGISGITDGDKETAVHSFSIEEPVDRESIKTLVIGNEEIAVK